MLKTNLSKLKKSILVFSALICAASGDARVKARTKEDQARLTNVIRLSTSMALSYFAGQVQASKNPTELFNNTIKYFPLEAQKAYLQAVLAAGARLPKVTSFDTTLVVEDDSGQTSMKVLDPENHEILVNGWLHFFYDPKISITANNDYLMAKLKSQRHPGEASLNGLFPFLTPDAAAGEAELAVQVGELLEKLAAKELENVKLDAQLKYATDLLKTAPKTAEATEAAASRSRLRSSMSTMAVAGLSSIGSLGIVAVTFFGGCAGLVDFLHLRNPMTQKSCGDYIAAENNLRMAGAPDLDGLATAMTDRSKALNSEFVVTGEKSCPDSNLTGSSYNGTFLAVGKNQKINVVASFANALPTAFIATDADPHANNRILYTAKLGGMDPTKPNSKQINCYLVGENAAVADKDGTAPPANTPKPLCVNGERLSPQDVRELNYIFDLVQFTNMQISRCVAQIQNMTGKGPQLALSSSVNPGSNAPPPTTSSKPNSTHPMPGVTQ